MMSARAAGSEEERDERRESVKVKTESNMIARMLREEVDRDGGEGREIVRGGAPGNPISF